MDKINTQKLLTQGITLAKAAHGKIPPPANVPASSSPQDLRQQARKILTRVIKLDDKNISAWLWLSAVVETNPERRKCFEKILSLDPHHKTAQNGLARLSKQRDKRPPPTTALQKPPTSVPQEFINPSYHKKVTPKPRSTVQAAPDQEGCPFCGHPTGALGTTCPNCTLPLLVNCPACNTPMDVEWERCAECGQLLGDYRQEVAYFIDLADKYQQHNRASQAAEALQHADTLAPNQPDIYRRLAVVQAELGKSAEAIDTLQEALEAEPDNGTLYIALGDVYRQGRHFSKAAKNYAEAIAHSPESAEAHFALGDLYVERGKIKAAREPLEKATRLNPHDGLAWARLGQVYDELQQYQPTVKAYRQAARYLSPELVLSKQVRSRLHQLSPELPAELTQGWAEFMRQATGPMLVLLLALLLDSGLQPWLIHWSGWLTIPLALFGTFLWISSTSLPQNPLICLAAGSPGLAEFRARPLVAFVGLLFWLAALIIILLPINQTLPELPY